MTPQSVSELNTNRIALIDGSLKLTYGQLLERSDAVAAALLQVLALTS